MDVLKRIMEEVDKTEINGNFCKKDIINKLGIERAEATYAFKRMIDKGEILFYKTRGVNPTYVKLKPINMDFNFTKSKLKRGKRPKRIIHDVVYRFIFGGDIKRMREAIQ